MRLLLILILIVSYANAKFGRSYRSSDTEVLPAEAPAKNVSSTTDTAVSRRPATTSSPIKPVENITQIESKANPHTMTETQHAHDKAIHERTDDLKIETLKSTLEYARRMEQAKSEQYNYKSKKALENSGDELPDISEELSYDEIEEKVEKQLSDQYKDEDDYSSAELVRTSTLSTASNYSTGPSTPLLLSASTNATRSSPSAISSANASTAVTVSEASTSKEKALRIQASKRTTASKASRTRNTGAAKISISMGTVEDTDQKGDATLGKMNIGCRKTTRAEKIFIELKPKEDTDEVAQPQKLSGLKNISDFQPRRIHETTTKRIIEILRTMKYRKNAAPATINKLENNLEKSIILFLSFSVLAYSAYIPCLSHFA